MAAILIFNLGALVTGLLLFVMMAKKAQTPRKLSRVEVKKRLKVVRGGRR